MCFRAIKNFGFVYLNSDDDLLCNDTLSNVLKFAGNPIYFFFFLPQYESSVLCKFAFAFPASVGSGFLLLGFFSDFVVVALISTTS